MVEAKLHPPAPRPSMVVRTRLLDRLGGEPRLPVVSVIAPAGYGKTTLLAEWVARFDGPAAWLTLDDLDNSAGVFLTYLAAALDRVQPIDGSISRSLAAAGQRIVATAVPRLAAELGRWPRPGLVVLDDAQRLVDRTALDAVAELIALLPPGVRIAIAGRFEPDLPLGRLRAQRDLLELDRTDLALDASETEALAAAAGLRADRRTAESVTKRAEGWAAGIYLALLADGRRRARPATGEPVRISGGDGYIADYIASEVRDDLADPGDVELLARTSLVEIVEPGLAETLAGRSDASDRLRALARSNLLIEETASDRSYRYHNLLREYLEAELTRREPGLAPVLHQRAAEWFEARGRIDLAVDHRIRGGDTDAAAALITRTTLATFYAGQVGTIDRWLGAFDRSALERHPALAVIAGWIHLLEGRAEEAEQAADVVDRAHLSGPTGDGAASFDSSRAMLRAIMARHGVEQALTDASFAADAEPPDGPWRTNALWLLGSTRMLNGDPVGGERAFDEAVETGAASGATAMVALAMRAELEMARGDWARAEEDVAQSQRILASARFGEIVPALIVHAMAARAALHRGQPERARQELVRAQIIRPLTSTAAPWFSVWALLDLAAAFLAASDPDGARSAIRDAESIARRRPAIGPVLEAELASMRSRLGKASRTLLGSSTLTTAELRLLPALSTYLSFQEIADRLVISRNTVKTQAIAIYGKLQASSRSEAVEHAVELGLLEPFPGFRLAEAATDRRRSRARSDGRRRAAGQGEDDLQDAPA
jgi:LuxR family maltose regulon positive regulatory protein